MIYFILGMCIALVILLAAYVLWLIWRK